MRIPVVRAAGIAGTFLTTPSSEPVVAPRTVKRAVCLSTRTGVLSIPLPAVSRSILRAYGSKEGIEFPIKIPLLDSANSASQCPTLSAYSAAVRWESPSSPG